MKIFITLFMTLLLAISLSFLTPLWAAAETYALVIGINKYDSDKIRNLKGAVNDANAIEAALRATGIPNDHIVKLTDAEATKQAIKTQWQQFVRDSNKGDTLIFSFAGHGIQEKDTNNDEALRDPKDTLDETLILSGFAKLPKKAHQQRLVDDELHQLFLMAAGKRVIYVADACHSGDSFRSINKKFADYQWQSRYVSELSELTYTPSTDSVIVSKELALENFYFFASTESRKNSLEGMITIDGVPTPHGALSWAFSQALQDKQLRQDGEITLTELAQYVSDSVKNITASRQFTDIQPRTGKDALFAVASTKPKPSPTAVQTVPTLRLAIKGDTPDWLKQLEALTVTSLPYTLSSSQKPTLKPIQIKLNKRKG